MMASVRSAAFAVWFCGLTTLFGLAGLPIRLFAPRLALPLARRWARTVLGGLPAICGIRVVVTGLEHIPCQGPVLLASQHQSTFDTLLWMQRLERPSYVMKEELRRIPLFGPLLEPAGMIPVDRAAGAAALRRLLAATSQAAARSRQIVIFPEGTRTSPGDRARLQPGVAAIAARIRVRVLPVATDSGRCWPRGVLGKRAGVIHVAIGPPLAPDSREALLADIERFWRRAEADGFDMGKAVGNSVEKPASTQPTMPAETG